jgi:hypothetical protein
MKIQSLLFVSFVFVLSTVTCTIVSGQTPTIIDVKKKSNKKKREVVTFSPQDIEIFFEEQDIEIVFEDSVTKPNSVIKDVEGETNVPLEEIKKSNPKVKPSVDVPKVSNRKTKKTEAKDQSENKMKSLLKTSLGSITKNMPVVPSDIQGTESMQIIENFPNNILADLYNGDSETIVDKVDRGSAEQESLDIQVSGERLDPPIMRSESLIDESDRNSDTGLEQTLANASPADYDKQRKLKSSIRNSQTNGNFADGREYNERDIGRSPTSLFTSPRSLQNFNSNDLKQKEDDRESSSGKPTEHKPWENPRVSISKKSSGNKPWENQETTKIDSTDKSSKKSESSD